MSADTLYIVNFQDAVDKFRRVVNDPEMPAIDMDFVLHRVLTTFIQPDPMTFAARLSLSLVEGNRLFTSGDYLYETFESFANSPDDINDQEVFVRDYLREAIFDLANQMCQTMTDVGLFLTGKERYQITSRRITDDTYIFKQARA